MANVNVTIAGNAGFIPQVWAQRALDILRANIVLAKLVAKDTDFEPGWIGKTLNIPYPGTFTAGDKAADTAATVQQPTGGSSVPVTLNKHKYVDFIVEDIARAQASSELLDRYIMPAITAIAEAVETDLFALYAGLSGSVGTSGTDLSAAVLRTARKILNDKKVSKIGRFAVISDKDEIALLGDSNLATYFANAKPEAIAEGSIGRLYGFDIYGSQLVPVVTGSPNSTKNLVGTKDMFILASRPFKDPPGQSGVQATTVVDPTSGLAIRVLSQYSMADRGQRIGFDILYGVAELRDECGLVVLS